MRRNQLWSLVAVSIISLFVIGGLFLFSGATQSDKFETIKAQESRRDRWMQPDRVLDAIGVKPGMVIGEAGAGQGYFTFKLARRVGPTGKVYANDINSRALDVLRERCEHEGINNIETILGKVEEPLFPSGELDLVIFVNAFHDFEKPISFLRNLKAALKPGATVVVVDQDPNKAGSHSHFLTQQEVKSLFDTAGYEFLRNEEFLSSSLILIFRLRES